MDRGGGSNNKVVRPIPDQPDCFRHLWKYSNIYYLSVLLIVRTNTQRRGEIELPHCYKYLQ